jgi:hypothetical protein
MGITIDELGSDLSKLKFGVDRDLKAINTEEEHGINKTIELNMELKVLLLLLV